MRSTKEELVRKGVLMPDGTDKNQDSKINVFLFSSGIHEEKKGISTAADSGQSGWPVVESNGIVSKARSLRAQAQLIETETKTWTFEKRAEKD
ncbi:hypothetical protein TNCV_766911 [Trichonephila clavipes]|nr:hypothetical protein TNCV_766911 [Trichonephila clavipes]